MQEEDPAAKETNLLGRQMNKLTILKLKKKPSIRTRRFIIRIKTEKEY